MELLRVMLLFTIASQKPARAVSSRLLSIFGFISFGDPIFCGLLATPYLSSLSFAFRFNMCVEGGVLPAHLTELWLPHGIAWSDYDMARESCGVGES